MVCSRCGATNRAGRKFCARCAAPLAVLCRTCGAANEPEELFCGECAAPLTQEGAGEAGGAGEAQDAGPRGDASTKTAAANAAPSGRFLPGQISLTAPGLTAPGQAVPGQAAPSQAVAERRLVTVLFADLVGFTPFAEGRDAEAVRETLSAYFDLAREIVGRYGGTVEKFIGDAVMAVWGAPVAHEDDAERAVRAALELVDAVPRLDPALAARGGVLTGETAVTIGATDQGLVAGDIVNTASRLQSSAAKGTVIVGEATRRATGRAIVYEDVGEQTLKGKAEPVPAWRAVRVVAERGGRNRAETMEAPFVGRDEELRLLKDLFHATGREGRARLVSVVGPAGIGKSRLAWEFLKYVDGLVETVWWHDGRSPAYGDGITFWALGEMVRGRAGLLETDDETTTRAKIAQTLLRHVPDEEERRWVEPALLALLGLGGGLGGALARPEELFGAWRTFFERLAATAPVVMVFEDFHYADGGLIDFVDHLMEWSRAAPLYVLTLARPDLIERRPDWGAAKRNFTSVYLEPLSEPAMRQLLAGLVPGLPDTAARAIVERSGGVPLYAIETVRMLVSDGRLVQAGDAFTPVGDLTTLEVPETLHALIAARLDGLPTAERGLLADAAVLGQSFTPAAVAAVAGVEESEVERPLQALVRRELLVRESDPRSPERGQYSFVQALIREVAYATLARRDRTTRHLAAARFFESLGSDELAGALAGHYLAAHRHATDPAQIAALAGQARIALSAAAERASALGSQEQAIAFLRQALEVTDDPLEQASLLERAGQAAQQGGRTAGGRKDLERALELREAAGDHRGAARSAALLADAIVDLRGGASTVDDIQALADRYEDVLEEEPGAVALVAQLSRVQFLHDRWTDALTNAERALIAAERLDLVDVVADVLASKGPGLASVGRTYEGLGLMEASLQLAEARGSTRTALRARNNLAYMLIYRDPFRSLGLLLDGLATARRLGDRRWTIQMSVNVMGTLNSLGRSREAQAVMAEAEALEPEGRDRWWLAIEGLLCSTWLGSTGSEEVELVAASEAYSSDPQVASFVRWVRADVAFLAGRYADDRALRYEVASIDEARAGLNLAFAARASLLLGDAGAASADLAAMDATRTRGPLLEAHRRRIVAGIAGLEGRRAEALAGYREAMEAFRALRVPEDAIAALDMVAILGASEPACVAAVERAREVFTAAGYVPLLRRLDALAGVAAEA